MRTAIIIPAWNEVAAIGRVLAEIPTGIADEVFVVDGGSTDGTLEVARAAGATVLRQLGRGYGHATDEAESARRTFSELEDIELETTYTAKCAAAFLSLAAQPPYRGRNLLFWNTYSSVDPGARLDRLPDFHQLPAAFHRFFHD